MTVALKKKKVKIVSSLLMVAEFVIKFAADGGVCY